MQALPNQKQSFDFSGAGILLSNAFAIVLAVILDWDLRPMMAIYWGQSVIIGIFHFFRMMKLRNFCTSGFTSNGKPVPETPAGKRSTAWFFAMHYGFFHFVYFVFVIGILLGKAGAEDAGQWSAGAINFAWMGAATIGFLLGHLRSFRQNVENDLAGKPNLGIMMFLPYARIVPMHLTIIFGMGLGSNRMAVLLFSLLKTGADYLMHIVEHKVLQKKISEE